ncbi:hypothetical protein FB007_12814 [Sinorhizobium medicae]|nr:hypothetical protein FB007_12814 [Sinorhizobium medicae]
MTLGGRGWSVENAKLERSFTAAVALSLRLVIGDQKIWPAAFDRLHANK